MPDINPGCLGGFAGPLDLPGVHTIVKNIIEGQVVHHDFENLLINIQVQKRVVYPNKIVKMRKSKDKVASNAFAGVVKSGKLELNIHR